MDTELVRDCSATAIPAGEAVTLLQGERVTIAQTLGGNVTVRSDRGLFRIDSVNVDALGDVDLGEGAPASAEGGDGGSASLEDQVWAALKECYDPEIPVNIVDLGLIYDLRLDDAPSGKSAAFVKMTLTAQGCGMGPVIAQDAKMRIEQLDSIEKADVEIVWDPVWNPNMISDEGRKILGLE